jgi:ABC-2 type transport system permease protein
VDKVWAVIRREFVERVRTKWFLISTVLGPIFMIAVTVLPAVLAGTSGGARHIALLDEESGTLADRLIAQLETGNQFRVDRVTTSEGGAAAAMQTLTERVQAKGIEGFLVVTGATLESGTLEYRGRNVSSIRDMALMGAAARQAVMMERLTRRGVDPGIVQESQARISLSTLRITKRGATGETGEATFFLAYVVGFVMYMAIFLYSVNVMRSVLEEKQTRIIEVLVSSLRPFQLLLGKVVGVGAVGLVQMGVWGVFAAAMIRYKAAVFSLFKVPAEQVAAIQLPAIGSGMVMLVLAYFLLGYLLYSAMFAVVGASVSTDAEAQQAQMPVVMLLIPGILVFPAVLNDPAGSLSSVMGLVPFWSPIIMPIRYAASDVPAGELLASLALLALVVVGVVWVAARIYRVGILMYGKRPGIAELVRWARQS